MTHAKHEIPTLPRKVAEAIEDVRKFYGKAEVIAAIVNDRGYSVYANKMPTLIRYARDNGIEKLMRALVNGYEVEKSPEEKVREYYRRLREQGEKDIQRGEYNEALAKGEKRTAVVITLDLLGIKIEGVNA